MNNSIYPENEDFSEDDIFEQLKKKQGGEPIEEPAPEPIEPDPEDDFLPFFGEEPEPQAMPAFDPLPILEELEEEIPADFYDEPQNFDEVPPADETEAYADAEPEAAADEILPEEPVFDGDVLSEEFLGEELLAAVSEQEIAPIDPIVDTEYGDIPEEEESDPDPAEAEPAKHSRRNRPGKRGRPRLPKGSGLLGIPHLIASALWLVMILAIGVSLGRVVWVCAADVLAFGREEKIVTVSVTREDTIETIAEKLNKAGLVRYPQLFKLYADLSHAEDKITTGTFTLNTIYDYHALVGQMSPKSSNRVIIEDVLIPEGYSCRQIFALLERKGICAAADLEEYAAQGELKNYWFLENVERGDKYCLEGFLFPDTYDFYENSSPKAALEKMLNGFQARITEEIYSKLPELNERLSNMMRANGCSEEYIAANQLDLRQVITVASLIEKEMAAADEAPIIASVIYNRLTQDQVYERYLNIDAAIFYALGEHKEALTAEDLQVDSPYNTYTYSGLVPGPIASPGLVCINAALNPQSTEYYYYVLEPSTGKHHFSKTFEEHEKYVEILRAANG